MAEPLIFSVGDKVYKPHGYEFEGEVRAAYHSCNGEAHYVVEHATRWQHIFTAKNIRPLSEKLIDSPPVAGVKVKA